MKGIAFQWPKRVSEHQRESRFGGHPCRLQVDDSWRQQLKKKKEQGRGVIKASITSYRGSRAVRAVTGSSDVRDVAGHLLWTIPLLLHLLLGHKGGRCGQVLTVSDTTVMFVRQAFAARLGCRLISGLRSTFPSRPVRNRARNFSTLGIST